MKYSKKWWVVLSVTSLLVVSPEAWAQKAKGNKQKPVIPAVEAAGGYGPEAAREYLKTMTVPEGLEVTVFASEPLLRKPTNMDIDAEGRVWVTEAVNYGSSWKPWGVIDPAGDRIAILEDTNHDGRADLAKTYYQDLSINSSYGICVLGQRVIISCSPNVLSFTGHNDKSDDKKVVFSGIGGVDRDHGVHAFVFGPDGKLYFNFGNMSERLNLPDGKPVMDVDGFEVSVVGKHGNKEATSGYRQGVVFRCNLDNSQVEVVGHNFRNNYEVALDSFGTMWQSDNDDDGNKGTRVVYVMEHGNFGYTDEMTGAGWHEKRSNMEQEIPLRHWHQNDPGVVPNLLNTGAGAPTGMAVYEGKLLPKKFQNQLIGCDAGTREVRAYLISTNGAGYMAKAEILLTSSDSWFRPSDVCVAPDGSILVADWHDGVVGGHNIQDRKLERMHGRIYRIAPKGQKYMVPKLDLSTPAGCVEALQSPTTARRYVAWAKLSANPEWGKKELVRLWHGSDARTRARALYLLAHTADSKVWLQEAMKDKNPDIRLTALRAARAVKADVIPLVTALSKDADAQVRRECALSLRHEASPEAAKLWAQLALQHDGRDRWYLEALGIGADKQENEFFKAWLECVGEHWDTPGGRDIIWRSRALKSIGYLTKIISNKATPEADRPRYFRALDFVPNCPEKDSALLELLTVGGK